MLKLSVEEEFINELSPQKFICPSCQNEMMIKRGTANYAKRNFGGPFCPKCGIPFLTESEHKMTLN